MKRTEHITSATRAQVAQAVNAIGARMERARVRREGRALAERLLGNPDLFDELTDGVLAAEEVQ